MSESLFFMSCCLYSTLLPQISARNIPFCLLFSCPGVRIVRFCHRFQPGVSPCACFSHVPETEYCISATKKPRPRKSPRIPKAVALIIHYFGLTRPYQIPPTKYPKSNFRYQFPLSSFRYQPPPIIPSQAQDTPLQTSQP